MPELSRWSVFRIIAAVVGMVAIGVVALDYLIPAPPSKIAIATAYKGGSYERLGHEYAEVLARSRVTAEVLETNGTIENLKLLRDPQSGVQAVLAQGGVSQRRAENSTS